VREKEVEKVKEERKTITNTNPLRLYLDLKEGQSALAASYLKYSLTP